MLNIYAKLAALGLVAVVLLLGFGGFSGLSSSGNSPTQSVTGQSEWRPASFKGLTVGTSTADDLAKTLGKPVWSGLPEGMNETDPFAEIWNDYEITDPIPGRLTVQVSKRNKRITEMSLRPKDSIGKSAIIAVWGSGYRITKYARKICDSEADYTEGDLFESTNGNEIFMEYRELGIAIRLDSSERVIDVFFIEEEIGSKEEPPCKGN